MRKPTQKQVLDLVTRPCMKYSSLTKKGRKRKFIWGMDWNTQTNHEPPKDIDLIVGQINYHWPDAEAKQYMAPVSGSRERQHLTFFSAD